MDGGGAGTIYQNVPVQDRGGHQIRKAPVFDPGRIVKDRPASPMLRKELVGDRPGEDVLPVVLQKFVAGCWFHFRMSF